MLPKEHYDPLNRFLEGSVSLVTFSPSSYRLGTVGGEGTLWLS